jgi:hypothetical protein
MEGSVIGLRQVRGFPMCIHLDTRVLQRPNDLLCCIFSPKQHAASLACDLTLFLIGYTRFLSPHSRETHIKMNDFAFMHPSRRARPDPNYLEVRPDTSNEAGEHSDVQPILPNEDYPLQSVETEVDCLHQKQACSPEPDDYYEDKQESASYMEVDHVERRLESAGVPVDPYSTVVSFE